MFYKPRLAIGALVDTFEAVFANLLDPLTPEEGAATELSKVFSLLSTSTWTLAATSRHWTSRATSTMARPPTVPRAAGPAVQMTA